jgi:hypothetical protein
MDVADGARFTGDSVGSNRPSTASANGICMGFSLVAGRIGSQTRF